MARNRRWIALTALAVVPLSACGKAAETKAAEVAPSRVEAVKGSAVRRVVLSAQAAERTGVTTVAVRDAAASGFGAAARTVIPYAALIYGSDGATWTYTTVGLRAYQRSPITVERIENDLVYLSQGPPVGTPVVSVGAAELYGTEFFADHE